MSTPKSSAIARHLRNCQHFVAMDCEHLGYLRRRKSSLARGFGGHPSEFSCHVVSRSGTPHDAQASAEHYCTVFPALKRNGNLWTQSGGKRLAQSNHAYTARIMALELAAIIAEEEGQQ